MTRYVLDTDTLIDFSKGWEPTRSRILEMTRGDDVLGVCAITVTEFYSGLPPEQRPVWDEFLASLVYWDISRDAAMRAGVDRYKLSLTGRTITTADSLVAALARDQQATILTNNTKDYPLPGISLLSLRASVAPRREKSTQTKSIN